MKFTDQAFFDELYPAIREVEKVSSVEIVTMVYKQSHHYLENVFIISSAAAILFSAYMMFSDKVFDPWVIYFASLGVFSMLFVLFLAFPPLKRLLVSQKVRQRRPFVLAHSAFSQARMCDTRDRTAILIFVSVFEKQVVFIADKGVRESIPRDELQKFQENLAGVFSDNEPAQAFLDLLKSSKEMFERYMPVRPDDVNELQDDLFFKIKF